MRRAGFLARALPFAVLACLASGQVAAQGGPDPLDPSGAFSVGRLEDSVQGGIVTINQQALFENSAFGRASLQRLEDRSRALQVENRQIEEALEAEERALTERRPLLTPEDFRALADAFDDKVEGIRNAQEAKGRDIARLREADQQAFFGSAVPILVDLLREKGASVLLDQSAIVLSLDRVDITAEAIARVDLRRIDPTEAEPDLPLPEGGEAGSPSEEERPSAP
ncbi:MAG: OmpH family outer membrane protein [Pseudorhodobacter sp.]